LKLCATYNETVGGIKLADHRFGNSKSWLLLTPKFYNLFAHLFIIFLNTFSLSVLGIILVLDDIFYLNMWSIQLCLIFTILFFNSEAFLLRLRLAAGSPCFRILIQLEFQFHTSTFITFHIPTTSHFTSLPLHWDVYFMKILLCIFRGKRLTFSLLHHTSPDVKNEWCYISSHICLCHVDRYKSYFVLLHISDWTPIFYHLT
jgi:hypothetical protein